MKTTIGGRIVAAREKKNLTRKQLAKRLDLTPAYLGHLENDAHVSLSQRVVDRLEQTMKLNLPAGEVESHNTKARKWYKEYRAARAAKADKKPAVKKPKRNLLVSAGKTDPDKAPPKQKVIRRRKPDAVMVVAEATPAQQPA